MQVLGCLPRFQKQEELPPPPPRLFTATAPPSPEEAGALAATMPPLAGAPLEAPKFHRTNWRPGQVFTVEDDPDRTGTPWDPPKFLARVDPRARAAETTVQELKPTTMPGSFARVVRGVLNEEECAELLACVNGKGFTPALLNVGGGQQQLEPYVRDGHRIIVDSPAVTDWLTEVLRPHLPETFSDGSRLESLNERCRFLCYTPGQAFEEHCDGCFRRPETDPKAGDRSRVTVQFYLHDVPKENGGATTFYPGRANEVGHQPESGSVLLFTQDLLHEGSLVKAGLKYTLRTEAMYSKRQAS
jgi:predicted 2-oxoglutarate/Fe(II)-dependent dioxygenase YbiX